MQLRKDIDSTAPGGHSMAYVYGDGLTSWMLFHFGLGEDRWFIRLIRLSRYKIWAADYTEESACLLNSYEEIDLGFILQIGGF